MTELGYKTLRESIVDIIRKRIINRELQPGQKIVEQELAKEFQTSRAPIREALRELENEVLPFYQGTLHAHHSVFPAYRQLQLPSMLHL